MAIPFFILALGAGLKEFQDINEANLQKQELAMRAQQANLKANELNTEKSSKINQQREIEAQALSESKVQQASTGSTVGVGSNLDIMKGIQNRVNANVANLNTNYNDLIENQKQLSQYYFSKQGDVDNGLLLSSLVNAGSLALGQYLNTAAPAGGGSVLGGSASTNSILANNIKETDRLFGLNSILSDVLR